VCRSPYDLARDPSLWGKDAYDTLEKALDDVRVDDRKTAIKALQNSTEQSKALKYLQV
jgi:hypothetical protein